MSSENHPPAAPARSHPPHLAHHFDTPVQQYESAVQAMWIFLATELLLFGGLFCAYAVYRANHPGIFLVGHEYLSKPLGALNTAILLCSSFTMATGVWAAQQGRQKLLVTMLVLTLLGACGFLGIKFIEYEQKWKHGLLWGKYYQPHVELELDGAASALREGAASGAAAPAERIPGDGAPATRSASQAASQPATGPATPSTSASTTTQAASDEPSWVFKPADSGPRGLLLPGRAPVALEADERVHNLQTFFAIYFGMTGLHALHVIAGMAVITWLLVRSLRGHFTAEYSTPVHLGGLYWHLVDVIWIYLFPLLYLIH